MKQSPSRSLIFIAFASFIGLGLFDGLFGVAWPSIKQTFGLTNDALGPFFVISMLSAVGASAIIGWLIERRGLAFVLIASFVLMAAGLLLMIGMPVWALFIAAAIIRSAGVGLLDGGMNTFAALAFRPRIVNWLHASFGVGTTIGSFLMTAVLAFDLSWRVGLGAMAAYMLLMGIAFIATRQRWVYTVADEKTADLPYAAVSNTKPHKQPVVIAGVLFFFLNTGLEAGVGTWAFTLLNEGRGIDIVKAGTWASLYWGAFTVGRILLGFIEQNQSRLIRIATVSALLGAILLWLNPAPIFNVISLMMIGIALAPIFPAQISLTPARVGQALSSRVVGYQVAAAAVGATVFPSIAGWLGDAWTLEAIPLLMVAIALGQLLLNEWLNRAGHTA